MLEALQKHLIYYFIFLSIETVGVVLIFLMEGEKMMQLWVILGMTLFYMLWGIIHQYIHHHLAAKIVVEYALMGCLGLTVSLILFKI